MIIYSLLNGNVEFSLLEGPLISGDSSLSCPKYSDFSSSLEVVYVYIYTCKIEKSALRLSMYHIMFNNDCMLYMSIALLRLLFDYFDHYSSRI